MTKIEEIAHAIKDTTDRYSLQLLELDITDVTLIALQAGSGFILFLTAGRGGI